jgi:hypothetical protein
MAQSEITRIESRPGMLLSTLASYLAGTGEAGDGAVPARPIAVLAR